MTDVLVSLDAIRRTSADLDTADAELLRLTAEVDVALRAHVNVRIELDAGPRGRLVFGKLDGEWRLIVQPVGEGKPTSLADAPRGRRAEIFASGDVNRLIEAAAGQLDAMVAVRREALERAREILSALRTVSR